MIFFYPIGAGYKYYTGALKKIWYDKESEIK
jgi:hypothetical protein